MRKLVILLGLLPLSACAGASSTVQAGIAAMQAAHADGCVSASLSVAGYLGSASACINGSSSGSSVTADAGKLVMSRGIEPPKPALPPASP